MSRTQPATSGSRVAAARPERGGSGRAVRVIGIIGRVLVAVGLLLLFYTVYLLWGTGVYTRQAQNDLAQQVQEAPLVAHDTQATDGEIPPARPASQPALGTALFEIRMERIGVRTVVVEGVGHEELKKGPGHFPECGAVPAADCVRGTAWPGEPGNLAISGHRTTYGAPFFNLNELQVGDPIDVMSGPFRYRYRVAAQEGGAPHRIVDPSAIDVVANHGKAELTLTTCHPRFSAAKRLVIHADYEGASRAAPPPAAAGEGGEVTPGDGALVPKSQPLIPTDVGILGSIAIISLLAAMALSERLRTAAAWSAVTMATMVGLWVLVFPQVVRLMPAEY